MKTASVVQSTPEYPGTINYLLSQYDDFLGEEARISDIISGFIDPEAEEALTATHVGSELSKEDLEDEDIDADPEEDCGLDLELVNERFTKLRQLQELALSLAQKHGRHDAKTKKAIQAVTAEFQEFKLVPKQFDNIVNYMREVMSNIRVQERIIMKICVEHCKMLKSTSPMFTGQESEFTWIEQEIAAGKSYAPLLSRNKLISSAV